MTIHSAISTRPSARPGEQGATLAFLAILFATIFLPLMAIAVDLPRLIWLRSQMQAAADAAAEAGAVYGVDVDYWQSTGNLRHSPGAVNAWARRVFAEQVANANLRQYTPSLTGISVQTGDNAVTVTAEAQIRILIPAITPPITIHVTSTSQSRAGANR
jgi:uncharacterized membrane protein